MTTRLATLAALVLAPALARAAVSAAPGWAVRTKPTPDIVQGGVVRRDGAVLVGQGRFGGGLQSIVRLERGGAVTVATGFNALGGFDLDAGGTLWVVDNCGECAGAATGDTLYTIPDALTRTTAVAAAGREVIAAGAIPAAQDVVVLAGGTALVTDAQGPGAGRIVRVTGGAARDLVLGLDFLGGIALVPDGTLRVANVDGSYAGAVLRYAADGTPQGVLAGGLSGAFATALDGDGNVLVSGGFTDDFSSSTVVAIAPDGVTAERARGFAFSSEMFHDAARDETLVLDVGAKEIVALCRDRDADGACDCAPVTAAKARLRGLAPPPGDERWMVTGVMTVPGAPAIDPVATGVRVVVAGAAGTLLDVSVPGGAFDRAAGSGWKVGRRRFTYRGTRSSGVDRVTLDLARRPGGIAFAAVGRRASLAAGPADLPLRARFEIDADAGQCGDARFAATGCAVRRRSGVRCR